MFFSLNVLYMRNMRNVWRWNSNHGLFQCSLLLWWPHFLHCITEPKSFVLLGRRHSKWSDLPNIARSYRPISDQTTGELFTTLVLLENCKKTLQENSLDFTAYDICVLRDTKPTRRTRVEDKIETPKTWRPWPHSIHFTVKAEGWWQDKPALETSVVSSHLPAPTSHGNFF